MRHRKRGRVLGRSPSHRAALYKNLAAALILTERDSEGEDNAPKHKGRIITTIQKAKEAKPTVERAITLAKRGLAASEAANRYATTAERNSEAWKTWRKSGDYAKWVQAIAPLVNARRRCVQLIGDKAAVRILFDVVAPRYADRAGGYTRVVRLAGVRLGDAGQKAMLEFVGQRDRGVTASPAPAVETT